MSNTNAREMLEQIYDLINKYEVISGRNIYEVKLKINDERAAQKKFSLFGFIPLSEIESIYFYCDTDHPGYQDEDDLENEYLYKIDLSKASRVFDFQYKYKFRFDKDFFETLELREMFEELKKLGADYSSSSTFEVYFRKDKAKKIHEMLPDIIKKYEIKVAQTYINRKRLAYEGAMERFVDIPKADPEYDISYNYKEKK